MVFFNKGRISLSRYLRKCTKYWSALHRFQRICLFLYHEYSKSKKKFGTTFLRDQNIAHKITDSLLPLTRDVLEIGPGMGVLTRHLFHNANFSVRAIDIDKESIAYLHQEFPEHQDRILYGDFLKTQLVELYDHPFSIIGNLPYNISSQIFFRILKTGISSRKWYV